MNVQNRDYPPFFLSKVSAGFPSPADDYIEKRLDLNDYLVKHPAATFFVRVSGDSMEGAGIYNDDLLVVDRALEVRDNVIVIAVVDGELLVKRLRKAGERVFLLAEKKGYPPLEITGTTEFEVWGVVTCSVHHLKP
ncbi:MAG: translesion error-prone DNA polymerase V autoproteolytic subunit [Proteobacteria bacterium]|nr:translesion error-prone DNA polymerase V autoproteolytic subunit [Pseudomonadota bacterium]